MPSIPVKISALYISWTLLLAMPMQASAITEASIVVLKDGIVTCYVFDAFKAGGIDCLLDKGQRLSAKIGNTKFSTDNGEVERTKLGNRVCYTLDGFQSGGISCLDVE